MIRDDGRKLIATVLVLMALHLLDLDKLAGIMALVMAIAWLPV